MADFYSTASNARNTLPIQLSQYRDTMSEQYVKISPEADLLVKRLRDNAGFGVRVCHTIDRLNQLTIGHIQRDYLSQRGPLTLGVITNRLRGSIRASLAYPDGSTVRSGIGSNVVYAAAHEFGFDGTVNVKAHQRRSVGSDRYHVAGVTVSRITSLRMGLLTKSQAGKAAVESGKYKFSRKPATPAKTGGVVNVKAHQMQMHIKARHYVSNGIKDRLQGYGNALSTAILSFWKGEK
jgi:hypothetical protein